MRLRRHVADRVVGISLALPVAAGEACELAERVIDIAAGQSRAVFGAAFLRHTAGEIVFVGQGTVPCPIVLVVGQGTVICPICQNTRNRPLCSFGCFVRTQGTVPCVPKNAARGVICSSRRGAFSGVLPEHKEPSPVFIHRLRARAVRRDRSGRSRR